MPDEKQLLNDIFKNINPPESTPDEEIQNHEEKQAAESGAIKPIPLKTVQELLRDAEKKPEG